MSDYVHVENNVRLTRRMLVALNLGDDTSAKRIEKYLRKTGLKFKLPRQQSEEEYNKAVAGLPLNERWLADHYGAVIYDLPNFGKDTVFLNSKWVNPYTLYVRLVEEVPELERLGEVVWLPESIGGETEFRPNSERMHKNYLQGVIEWAKKFFSG